MTVFRGSTSHQPPRQVNGVVRRGNAEWQMLPAEQQLQWAVQALAQPAEVQPTLFPSFVVVADELALEFDHWRDVADGEVGGSWSPVQRAAVMTLDQLLS